MKTMRLFLAALLDGTDASTAQDHWLHAFKKTQRSEKFWCEGATFGELNRDDKPDIISDP